MTQFELGALGEPLTVKESQAFIGRLYGKKPGSKVLLAESAAQLDLEQRASQNGVYESDVAAEPHARLAGQPAAAAILPPPTAGVTARAVVKPSEKSVSARLGASTSTGFHPNNDSAVPNGTPDRSDFPVLTAKPTIKPVERGGKLSAFQLQKLLSF